ncbi:MAG: mechanosensitive ion channel family protein [Verrucomicrobia bacterium]|nr:mechanosensitive ion channel family protein [Verrucomicrobiota bacterium]
MKRLFLLLGCLFVCAFAAPAATAADAAPPLARGQASAPPDGKTDAERNTVAAAAVATAATREGARSPDLLEHLVDVILELFNVRTSGNTVTHYVISALLLACALLARRIVTGIIFVALKKLAAKTETTLDDKLFPAVEAPAAAFVMVTGIFAALKVLKLSTEADQFIGYGSRVAFSLAIFWGLWRALGAVLDHGQEIAKARNLGIAAFMPWIKKTLLSVFVVVGVLLTIQGLGYDVKALLAGLGLGGLAFALAAQDTLANVFGSIVVAIDQPFKVGETVRIGGNVGSVEDIGLRSTRIRLIDKSLLIVPNKTVAAEAITNLARFTQRRAEQVIGLTYDTKPEQMDAIVAEIRQIVLREAGVDPASVMVYFRDFNASSLDIWVVYASTAPDFQPFMAMRQRINLNIMRAVEARGLSFAFPTQTMHLAGEVAQKLTERSAVRGA